MRVLSQRSLVCGAGILLFAPAVTRATSDTEILQIIQLGIFRTTMPPTTFSGAQANLRRVLEVLDV
jgi:hypothetical protein